VHIDSPTAIDCNTKIAQVKKAFSIVASLVRIHLISMLDVNELLRSTKEDIRVSQSPQDYNYPLICWG